MDVSTGISAVIITHNESANIARCIKSVNDLVDEVLVVDSYSTDNTCEIAKNLGARVIEHPFEGHIQQKN
ncbi:MAG: glycosyltransferase, partial [Bacteroidota bacterium]